MFARIHPRYQTPDVSTLLMGAVSIVWYVGLTAVSENILADSIAALGLMIAFYYGITGFACAVYYRRELTKSVRNFVYVGVLPVLGGLSLAGIFVKSCYDLGKVDSGSTKILGVGGPLVIGLGGLLLGVVLMIWWNLTHPEFFRRRLEVADPTVLDGPARS
jgi:amino acid transporter